MINSYKYDTLIKLQKLVDNKVISQEDKQYYENDQELIIVNNVNTFLYVGTIEIKFISEIQKKSQGSYKVYSKTRNPYIKVNCKKVYLKDLEHIEDKYATLSTSGINGDLEWKSYNIGLATVLGL